MYFLRIIIFLLLFIISFSCKTKLEKQGWQRTAIVSQVNKTAIGKDKELVVQKLKDKNSYYFWLYAFKKDSTGKIINAEWGFPNLFNSDIAYYKWESDSVCLVKLLNQGIVRASVKLLFNDPRRGMEILDESKK
jgi:hypothetical protein